MDTCAPRRDADVGEAHTAHTRLTHVAETLIDKHIAYKGGQPSADGDTYTSHTKTQGRRAALGTHRPAGPRHRCTPSHKNRKASQRPTHATKSSPKSTDTYTTDKDPADPMGDLPRHTVTTCRPSTNGQQRTPINTNLTYMDTQTHHTHTHRHHFHRYTHRYTHMTYTQHR